MIVLICPYCGSRVEAEAFVSATCVCGASWQADEDTGGNPTGEWEPSDEEEE